MVPTPLSELYLLSNVDLDPDYNYTIDFDDAEDQQAYFQDKISNTLTETNDYSFIRLEEALKVCESIEDLDGVNYLMFKNDTRWHYCFIVKKEYVNPNVTKLTLKYDVYQTFMFDFEIDESFVDREHQDRFDWQNKPVFNLEPENLEIGSDYKQSVSATLKDTTPVDLDMYWIMIVATKSIANHSYNTSDPTTWEHIDSALTQKGYRTPLYTYLLPVDKNNALTEFYTPNYNGVDQRLWGGGDYNGLAKSEAILSARVLSYCPIKRSVTKISEGKYRIVFTQGYQDGTPAQSFNKTARPVKLSESNWGGVDLSNWGGYMIVLDTITSTNENVDIGTITRQTPTRTTTITSSRAPIRDPKVWTYPYYFFEVGDHKSDPLIVKNEKLGSTPSTIKFKQSLGVQSKSKFYVDDYLGDNGKEHASINNTIDELPLMTDAYTSYLSSSKASATTGVAVNIGASILQAGIGIATGGVGFALGAGQAIGIGQQIAGEMIKKQNLKETPDTIRKQGNNIEFDILDNNLNIEIRVKQIETKWRDKIYYYFEKYGYKCNEFKKPDIRSRYYFNFIKTIGANLKTEIDAEYRTKIKEIFDKGITIWHYRDENTFLGVNTFTYDNVEMANL